MSDSSGDGESQYNQQGGNGGGNNPDRNWEWIACVYDMKRSTPESEITWNLSPSIMLTLPSEQNVQPKVDLVIESSKSFIFTEGLGWNWHKSWNIPDIHCTLDIRDPLTQEKLLPPSKIYAEIYVVRAVINQIHTFHLVDVGIKGTNRSDFDSSRSVFTGLKFDTTSYNHEGSKFHLVIVVYLNQNKFEHPKILESRISPPIFVDSRKQARATQQQKAQKLSSFIDPFSPDNLDKPFVKRESKKKYNSDEPIGNNIEGLSSFFSAPNIRHKVKHPLFLAVRFNACVKIYYNVNIIPVNSNNDKFVEVMQRQLMEAYNRSNNTSSIPIEEKPLILTIEHNLTQQNFKSKKINEFLEPLHGDVLHVMIEAQPIPNNFRKLEDIEGVKEAYKKLYPKISQQKFSQGQDDEDDSYEQQQKPARGSKGAKNAKVKQEKQSNNKQPYQSDGSDDDDDDGGEQYPGMNPQKKLKGNNNEEQQQHISSIIDTKKLQMKNPAQQSEIILTGAANNNQQVASMILQGAKPSRPDKPMKAPGNEDMQQQQPQQQPAGKAQKPKAATGKRASKNAPAVTSQPEIPQVQQQQSMQPLQQQLPMQAPMLNQQQQQQWAQQQQQQAQQQRMLPGNPQSMIPPQYMSDQMKQQQQQYQQHNPNSMYPPQQQSQQQLYAAHQQQQAQLDPSQLSYQQQFSQTQQQQPTSQYLHLQQQQSQQFAGQQQQPSQQQQRPMMGNNNQLYSSAQSQQQPGYPHVNPQLAAAAAAAGTGNTGANAFKHQQQLPQYDANGQPVAFKQPSVNLSQPPSTATAITGSTPAGSGSTHLNNSQTYLQSSGHGTADVPEGTAPAVIQGASANGAAVPPVAAAGAAYTYQRNPSTSNLAPPAQSQQQLSASQLQQQQLQMQQQQQRFPGQKGFPQPSQQPGIPANGTNANFYDAQQTTLPQQSVTSQTAQQQQQSLLVDPVAQSQYAAAGYTSQQYHQQMNALGGIGQQAQQIGYGGDDDDAFQSYPQYGRYQSQQQQPQQPQSQQPNAQFGFNQNAINAAAAYHGYAQQQPQNPQQYAYGQQQQYAAFQGATADNAYMKGLGQQFPQYYQPTGQPVHPDLMAGQMPSSQNPQQSQQQQQQMAYQNQMRAQSNSIQQNYYVPTSGKADEEY